MESGNRARNAGFPAGRCGDFPVATTDLAAEKPPNLQTKSLRYAEPAKSFRSDL